MSPKYVASTLVPGSYAKAVCPTKRDKQVPFRVEVRILRVCTVDRFESCQGEWGLVPSRKKDFKSLWYSRKHSPP